MSSSTSSTSTSSSSSRGTQPPSHAPLAEVRAALNHALEKSSAQFVPIEPLYAQRMQLEQQILLQRYCALGYPLHEAEQMATAPFRQQPLPTDKVIDPAPAIMDDMHKALAGVVNSLEAAARPDDEYMRNASDVMNAIDDFDQTIDRLVYTMYTMNAKTVMQTLIAPELTMTRNCLSVSAQSYPLHVMAHFGRAEETAARYDALHAGLAPMLYSSASSSGDYVNANVPTAAAASSTADSSKSSDAMEVDDASEGVSAPATTTTTTPAVPTIRVPCLTLAELMQSIDEPATGAVNASSSAAVPAQVATSAAPAPTSASSTAATANTTTTSASAAVVEEGAIGLTPSSGSSPPTSSQPNQLNGIASPPTVVSSPPSSSSCSQSSSQQQQPQQQQQQQDHSQPYPPSYPSSSQSSSQLSIPASIDTLTTTALGAGAPSSSSSSSSPNTAPSPDAAYAPR